MTCTSDPESGGFQCVNAEDKEVFVPYAGSGNYICHPPEDYKKLLEYFKNECKN